MKRLSIYWKTVIISILTILFAISVLFIVVSLLTPNLTQQIQFERFNEQVAEIKEIIENNGVDKEELEQLSDTNVYFEIYENENLIYNSLTLKVKFNPDKNSEEEIENSIAIPYQNDSELLEHREKVTYQRKKYDIYVSKTITFTQEESKMLLYKTLPYFLVIGILAAIILSLLYAHFFSKKISYLSDIMDKMKGKKYPSKRERIEGDELQKLENDINSLYVQLLEEISIVNKFEEERQLFLRGITHELKTPIMAMGVTIEGILAGVEGYDNYEEALRECYQELQSMSNLVNEILDLAQIQSVKDVGIIQVSKSLDRILEVYQFSFLDKHIHINRKEYGEMKLTIPESHFDKILSNLISNITKYTPENGILSIETDTTYVRMMNTILPDTKINPEKIFEAFVTSDTREDKELYKSHGLGLYITSSILDQYHIHYRCWIENNQFFFEIYL